jgi:DNA replication initiation complex subunit (GINS family)
MLTFETIRELERAERATKNLQQLPEDLLQEIRAYLERKTATSEQSELEATRAAIVRLFELREHKLLDAALITARTGIPAEGISQIEKNAFESIVHALREYRRQLRNILEQSGCQWKVRTDLPEFIGPDMKVYKLKAGDVVQLPEEISALLAKQGLIEKSGE